jgi:hypothetical protein
MGYKIVADLASNRIPYPHSGVISSHKILRERPDAMLRFGRARDVEFSFGEGSYP